MHKRIAIVLAGLVAAGCSSSSSTSGGSSAGGATGTTGTTSAGSTTGTTGASSTTGTTSAGTTTGSTNGGNSLNGPLAFSPNIARYGFPLGASADGGPDFSEVGVDIVDGSGGCAAYNNPDGGQATATITHTVSVSLIRNNGPLTPGSYDLAVYPTQAQMNAGAGTLQLTAPGTTLNAVSGSVTLTTLDATAITGSFTAQMPGTDGGNVTLTGTFNANCPL